MLLTSREALIAWYDGYDVEIKHENTGWYLFNDHNFGITVFKSKDHEFRLKPRTITINGIEAPAPFEPKNGEDFYYLDCTSDNYGGWAKTSWRNVESDAFKNNTVFGAWRTEDEIKQVVVALRSIFATA